MNETAYKKIMSFWESHEKLLFVAKTFHSLAVGAVYLAFPFLLVFTALNKDLFCIISFFICSFSFVLLSLYRNKANAKRPSEVYGIPSAIKRDKKGKSFPSRHSFSAAVISVCLFHISLPLGATFLTISIIIATLRVILGLHFVKDAVAGLLIGTLCGIIALIMG